MSNELDDLMAEFEARKKAKSNKGKPGSPRVQVDYLDFPEEVTRKIRIVQLPNQKATEKFQRYYIGKFSYPGFTNESVWDGKAKKTHFIPYYEGNPIEAVRAHILKERAQHAYKSPKYEELDKLGYSVKPRDVYAFVALDRDDGKLKVCKVNAALMDEVLSKAKKPKHGTPWKAVGGWDFEVTNKGRGAWTVDPDEHSDLTTEELDLIAKFNYKLESWKNEATPEYYKKKGIFFNPEEFEKTETVETKEKSRSRLEELTEPLDDLPFDDDTPF